MRSIIILAALVSAALAGWTKTYNNVTVCQTETCMQDVQVTADITEYKDTCTTIYRYKFSDTPVGDVSNFVLGFNGVPAPVFSGCSVNTGSNMLGCNSFNTKFVNPMRSGISSTGACATDNQVILTVYNSSVKTVPIGIMSGPNCGYCNTLGPASNSKLINCNTDADCNNGNPCQEYMCASCKKCVYNTIKNCVPPPAPAPTPSTTTSGGSTSCPGIEVRIRSNLEGPLSCFPGQHIYAGFSLQLPLLHPVLTLKVWPVSKVVFNFKCKATGALVPYTYTFPEHTYLCPLNLLSWLPTSDVDSATSYQTGAIPVPALCGANGELDLTDGVELYLKVSALGGLLNLGLDVRVNVKLHYGLALGTAWSSPATLNLRICL